MIASLTGHAQKMELSCSFSTGRKKIPDIPHTFGCSFLCKKRLMTPWYPLLNFPVFRESWRAPELGMLCRLLAIF